MTENCETVIALLGQPNSGKSTLFNALTGMKQHVGNWPGKTVEKKEGTFEHKGKKYLVADLPGTYSLSANSDEEIIMQAEKLMLFVFLQTALSLNAAFICWQIIPESQFHASCF